jgi:putative SOS response-associated peptidase YedK
VGRYSVTKKRKDLEKEIAARLRIRLGHEEGTERFNVAPTQDVLAVVHNRSGRRVELLRWGLVPHWANGSKTGLTMINARAETLARRPAYRRLAERASHRCLVLADGFYEWIKAEDPRQPRRPLRFTLAGGGSFCFAGLWTTSKGLSSCTIVTTEANGLVAPVHDRMPVMLADVGAWEAWLDPALDAAAVTPLLEPFPERLMAVAAANPIVNSVENDGADCLCAP